MDKLYISADQLLCDAYTLGLDIIDSGFRPDLVLGIWRGGTPVAIAIHEALGFAGLDCDHYAIRASSYTGIAEQGQVNVSGLEQLQTAAATSRHYRNILLVDDVFDSGRTMATLVTQLQAMQGDDCRIRIATPYFKPAQNRTRLAPDYHLRETDLWLVFPHELQGLEDAELRAKPGLDTLMARLLALRGRLGDLDKESA